MMSDESIYFVRDDNGTPVGWSPMQQEFTDKEPTLKTDQEWLDFELKQNKEGLFSRLMQLCDSKQDEDESYMLKHKNTVGQRRRYQDKYERALAGEFSAEERAAIIANYEATRDAIRAFADLIELFRQTVDDWIVDGQLEKAEQAITAAVAFDATTNQADIEQLLSSV